MKRLPPKYTVKILLVSNSRVVGQGDGSSVRVATARAAEQLVTGGRVFSLPVVFQSFKNR